MTGVAKAKVLEVSFSLLYDQRRFWCKNTSELRLGAYEEESR